VPPRKDRDDASVAPLHRLSGTSLLLTVLVACSGPGSGGRFPLDTRGDGLDAILFPDLPETSQVPETAVDTALDPGAPPADTAPADTADTAPADTVTPEVVVDADSDDALPHTGACTYHTDCYPERVCARWETTGQLRCSDPCAGDADCGAGHICSKVPGSVQVGFCQDAAPGLAPGAPCTLDAACRSHLCVDDACADLCLDEAHCLPPGRTCRPVGDLAQGLLASACAQDPTGSIALGGSCTLDGFNYAASLCASGHCDLLAPVPGAAVCLPICKAESDCAPAEECNLVLFAEAERADAVPYDPAFTQRTHDAIAACYTPANFGTLPDGHTCTSRGECRSNKCLPFLPGSNQGYCTSFCVFDAHCPSAMACKLEALTRASEWLAADGHQAPGSWTFVRVCKFL